MKYVIVNHFQAAHCYPLGKQIPRTEPWNDGNTAAGAGRGRGMTEKDWPQGRRELVAAAVRARKCGNGNVRGPRAGGGDA